MSVQLYQLTHLFFLFLLVSQLGVILFSPEPSKKANITFGISSVLVLIAGFGLLAKYNYAMTSFWVLGKIAVWIVISAGIPIVAKRFRHFRREIFLVAMALLLLAVYFVIYKPV